MIDPVYQETLDYLYSFIDYETMRLPRDAAHYDLRRMYELLGRLGNPHQAARSVHIAGTNGKGSTAAMVASVLSVAGYATGLYTSPHLDDIRERIRINGELIAERELISLVQELRPEIEVVHQKATYGSLTTFELLTVLAFAYFSLKRVDFQVLEVGLGGRLDATNVVHPEVSIITSISFDHTEVLGSTLSELASQKAGIIKPGSPVVSSPQPDEAARVITGTCNQCGVELVKVGSDLTWQSLSSGLDGQAFRVKGRLGDYELFIPLLGRHQLENAAVAVAVLEVLQEKGFKISRGDIKTGLAQVSWPGRFQILSHHPLIVVDGAHNPDAARKLRQSLEQYIGLSAAPVGAGQRRATLIMGASFDKDVDRVVSELCPLFSRVLVTHSRHPRAMAPESLKAEFARHGVEVEVVDDVGVALSLASPVDDDLVCVAGSLFVVGEAIEQVRIKYPKKLG